MPYPQAPQNEQEEPLPDIGGSHQRPHALSEYNYPLPRPLFRHRTHKMVQLTETGNFTVEIPVPDDLLSRAAYTEDKEFTHMKYTAVTGDPDEFVKNDYTLRQVEMERETEIFIVVTMYNEDETLFLRTWKSIVKNIAHICSKRKSDVWGPDGWKKIVVCVVSDGREKASSIHPKTLSAIGILGAYQEGVIKTHVDTTGTSAHVFEYTTQKYIDTDYKIKGANMFRKYDLVPIQLLFCLKEKNAKKINSHRWFFNAFGRVLNPNVCVLIDVGTKPSDKSIYKLWKAFHNDSMVGGACGEIYVEKGPFWYKLLNPLVAAQNFEYKMSNILDKPFESCFGFISVLPGAFSAYRYKALRSSNEEAGPLAKYFLGEKMHDTASVGTANMYLAEDRILCFELVTKRKERWILKYIKDAHAETDVPNTLAEFISQRRRWLNGSFFAGVHSITRFYQIFRSGHSGARKFGLLIQTLYNVINLIFNWFSIANFYLIFYFLVGGTLTNPNDPLYKAWPGIAYLFVGFQQLYLFALLLCFLAALGNRPQGTRIVYFMCFFLFGVIMLISLIVSGYAMYRSFPQTPEEWGGSSALIVLFSRPVFRDLLVSISATYGAYFISSFIYLDPWHMFTSFLQYMVLLPSFTNILMVYAFCNLHDISWGTKGDTITPTFVAPVIVKREEDGRVVADVDLPVEKQDINLKYQEFMAALGKDNSKKNKKTKNSKKAKTEKEQEDYFRYFRTRVVLFWMASNLLLVSALTTPSVAQVLNISTSGSNTNNPYLTVIMWSVAILSVMRFIGSIVFLVKK
ncbi:chitin synthase-domain-containing protein [Polychytrium aggregatum]|uniref:chitin synthase-domain-containing protein n=1 Tax=Polychytrium aggregatum TaxID=110093 RepID=UPI0022FEEBBF|nr:chitin synthase-domain-containing protein [Polychytrium aggregatum]KAI9193556.1 chitin synthase-domain-containing protein [Polychytrium aggregatum]